MKRIGKILAAIVALILGLVALQIVASESAEVVELETRDAAGEAVVTRLWVVDVQGTPVLRSGAGASGWYQRLVDEPRVRVTRAGETRAMQAVPAPELRDEINRRMRAKYGWRDRYISTLLGSRKGAIPVRLVDLP